MQTEAQKVPSDDQCPDPISGSFLYNPKDKVKMQRESDAMQPCELCFSEPGIRGRAGMAAGGKTRERKKGVKLKKPSGGGKECGGRGGLVTTTTNSTMSSDVQSAQSLCRRGGPGKDEVQQQGGDEESKRTPRRMCCPFTGAFAHAPYVQFVPYVLPT